VIGIGAKAGVWRPGSKLTHPFNPELGVGVVRRVEGRFLAVWFPAAERELTLATEGELLAPLRIAPGARARLEETGEEVEVAEAVGHTYRLEDGRLVDEADLWPLAPPDTPIEQLAAGRVDRLPAFRNRVEALRLARLREAGGLGSFLGGRIELFPHQLHTALRATGGDPVRWLLADEVGLGKTVEACLILSALVRTGRAERALVVAPEALVVQWLGELYRKFHQVFVWLDDERIESVARVVAEDANAFEVHPRSVIALERLADDPALRAQALAAAPDLVVLDEAHRLASPARHEALAPLVGRARHALLLTATPLQADRVGFARLVSLLHPEAFPAPEALLEALGRGEAVVLCTSAVRRADVGGLPPRRPRPVDLPALAGEPGVAPGAASDARDDPDAPAASDAPDPPDVRRDPRARWISEHVRGWAAEGSKSLVFAGDPAGVEALRGFLESQTRTRMAVFHEDMTPAARDMEVATFRETGLPVLLSSDAGSEGRNFQFCDRLVLYDLPWDPVVLEQRIGRLDRIGRRGEVEIVYFRQPGAHPDVAGLYERLDLFGRPAAGLAPALAAVEPALRRAAAAGEPLDVEALAAQIEGARRQAAADVSRVLYRDAYDPARDAGVLDLVPPELEPLTRKVCLEAAAALDLEVVEKGGEALYYIELGANATVDGLPDVPGGARFLGTFDRAEAVRRDEVDFFASGHPLVEGLLMEIEEGRRGRAAAFEVRIRRRSRDAEGRGIGEVAGLLALFKEGAAWAAVVVDAEGRLRPEWGPVLLDALSGRREGSEDATGEKRAAAGPQVRDLGRDWARQASAPAPAFARAIRELGARARAAGRGALVAAAYFRTRL